MDEVVENRAEEKSSRFELGFLAGGKGAEIGVLRNENGGFVFSPGVLPRIIKEMEIRSPLTERAAPSFEELAAQQGVQPVLELDELLGPHDPAGESAEEFSKLLRGWRSEGTGVESQR